MKEIFVIKLRSYLVRNASVIYQGVKSYIVQSNARNGQIFSNFTYKSGRIFMILPALSGALYIIYLKTWSDRSFLSLAASSREISSLEMAEDRHVPKREKRFLSFASVEYNNEIFMTPADFLYSVANDEPESHVGRKKLDERQVNEILSKTPNFKHNSERFFRLLGSNGLISYTEYLLLLCILTKPEVGFKIAFDMFDLDGSKTVDKDEFLVVISMVTDLADCANNATVLEKVLSRRRSKSPPKSVEGAEISESGVITAARKQKSRFGWVWDRPQTRNFNPKDTTLLVHLFGQRGDRTLTFDEFRKFMENFQTEVLEIEFNEFAGGSRTIRESDFARILLRFARLTSDEKNAYIERVGRKITQEKGISFEQFRLFYRFLNTLDDFTIAVKLYAVADLPVSQAEFARAVKVATGFALDPYLIDVVFKIFDTNDNGCLSYNEFIGVMNERLHRGFRTKTTSTEFWPAFKRCIREEIKRY